MSDYRRAGLLALCAVSLRIAAEFLLPLLYAGDDLLQLYALSAIFVSIGAIYLPTTIFMRHKEPPAYGRVRIGAQLVVWSVLLGWGVFQLSTGINALMSLGFETLGARLLGLELPPTQGWRLYATMLLVAVVPAITEEQFFRGALLSSWRPMGRRRALLLTALLFALMHFQPLAGVSLFLIGYVLGVVALSTGSVYPAMIVHGVNNLVAIFLTAASEAPGASVTAVTNEQLLLSIASYILFGALITVLALKRLRAPRRAEGDARANAGEVPPNKGEAPPHKGEALESGEAQGPGEAPSETGEAPELDEVQGMDEAQGTGEAPKKAGEAPAKAGEARGGLALPLVPAVLLLLAMNAAVLAIHFGWIA